MSNERLMDKEVVVYIHNGILAIKRNAFQSVLMRWMNLERIIQSEESQKEKNKQLNQKVGKMPKQTFLSWLTST